jgi:hypothetical protein
VVSPPELIDLLRDWGRRFSVAAGEGGTQPETGSRNSSRLPFGSSL